MLPLREFSAYPDFLRLLGARLLAGIAQQMLMVAVAWQMYNLTGSAWEDRQRGGSEDRGGRSHRHRTARAP